MRRRRYEGSGDRVIGRSGDRKESSPRRRGGAEKNTAEVSPRRHGDTEKTEESCLRSPDHPITWISPITLVFDSECNACLIARRPPRNLRRIRLRPLPAAHKRSPLGRQLSRLHARTRCSHAEEAEMLLNIADHPIRLSASAERTGLAARPPAPSRSAGAEKSEGGRLFGGLERSDIKIRCTLPQCVSWESIAAASTPASAWWKRRLTES